MRYTTQFILAITTVIISVSCQGKWTEEDKTSFMNKCAVDSTESSEYCDCVYDRISKEFKNPNTAIKTLKKEDFERLKEECTN